MKMIYRRNTPRNHGTITHEATMAIVIATVVMAGVAQTVAVVARQRREVDRQRIAQREVANVMEEVAASPWRELTEDSLDSLPLSADCTEVLTDAKLDINVANSTDGGKRIEVAVNWQTAAGGRVNPIRLVAWRYPTEEATDE